MTTLDIALKYAENGLQSFPCLPRDKKPMVRWAEAATTEKNMLFGWWEHEPNANVGIATGRRSGIVVVDIDADHGGYEALAELQECYGKLPPTWTSKTGTGGEHLFFKHPGVTIRNSAGKLGAGIDIRGDGGYVVAPPSIHPNGNKYEWIVLPSQTELAEMPAWMVDVLHEEEHQQIATGAGGNITAGGRNDALTRIAGSMRRKGLGEDSIFAAIKIHNHEHCNPPLTDGEVLQIARSVTRYPPQDEYIQTKPLPDAWDVIETLEAEIKERQNNPVDVWGIPYAWDFLSIVTGGKQKGELTIMAGEPGVGKSYWNLQDALITSIGDRRRKIASTPTLYWCGEMSRKQIFRRCFEMLGVGKRNMRTGNMSVDDWQFFEEAKAVIVNSPFYVSDMPLELKNVPALLEREIGEHGIEQAFFDYDWLINAPGQGEIEQSQAISRMMKQLSHKLNLSITLVSSVNKMGMDKMGDSVVKGNVSGSGKKLHDADVIYILTKFRSDKNSDLSILPIDYPKIVTLHISKGRELDYHLPNGAINYMRETPSPKFKELKEHKREDLPSWISRKDLE